MNRKRILLIVIAITIFLLVATPVLATFTVGYWKNRALPEWDDPGDGLVVGFPSEFPCLGTGFWADALYPDEVLPGDITYLWILQNRNARDATLQLAAQTIAAELNLASGACKAYEGNIQDLVALAHDFLDDFPVGSDPGGADRDYAITLAECLDEHNNIVDFPGFDYPSSPAGVCAADILS